MNNYYKGINELENKINKEIAQGIMDERVMREKALVEAAKESMVNPRIDVMKRADEIFMRELRKRNEEEKERIEQLRQELRQKAYMKQSKSNGIIIDDKEKEIVKDKQEIRIEESISKLAQIKNKAIQSRNQESKLRQQADIKASEERRLKDEENSKARQEADLRASRERQLIDEENSKARQEADIRASEDRGIKEEQEREARKKEEIDKMVKRLQELKSKAQEERRKNSQEQTVHFETKQEEVERKREEKAQKLAQDYKDNDDFLNKQRRNYKNKTMIDMYVMEQNKKQREEEKKAYLDYEEKGMTFQPEVQPTFLGSIKNAFNKMTNTFNPFKVKKAYEAYDKYEEMKAEVKREEMLEEAKREEERKAEIERKNQERKSKLQRNFGNSFMQKVNEAKARKEAERKATEKKQEKEQEPDFRARWGL